jgi:hypothetical protein
VRNPKDIYLSAMLVQNLPYGMTQSRRLKIQSLIYFNDISMKKEILIGFGKRFIAFN